MARRPFSTDPLNGIVRYYHDDTANDQFIIETVQDVQPILDRAKAQRDQTSRNTPWQDGMQKVASIPLAVLSSLVDKGILDKNGRVQDMAAFKRWLNDPDNRAFRTREGRV